MRLLPSYLVATFACLGLSGAARPEPKISKTQFENLPTAFFYFEDSSIIISHDSTASNIYRSEDDGATWKMVDEIPQGQAWDVWEHPFDKKKAYVLSDDKKHWRTEDQGKTWQSWEAPAAPSFKQVQLAFHAEKPGYIIYHGRICEGSIFNCQEASYYTKDNFDSDAKLLKNKAHGCMFARSTETFNKGTLYTVLCIVESESSPRPDKRRLFTSDDWFSDHEKSLQPKLDGLHTFEGIAGVAAVQKFLITAVKSQGTDEMLLFVSDNAIDWARAEFPSDHGGVHEDAYTVLESTPYSIQVDVLTTKKSNPVGSLFTSNSNGTYFMRNLDNTNRNGDGYVDFEKVKGIDGIILANQVDNAEAVEADRRATKKILSRISFDDGRTWQPLKSDQGEVHFHSVTNLRNGGRVFSSPAPGIIMGVGSQSKYLKPYDECDLYVSDDAGLNWKLARKEAHKYEFGDQGSILAAIFDEDPTRSMVYSTNHGKEWTEFQLPVNLRAKLLTTTPDSTTRKFTLVGTAMGSVEGGRHFILSIDFTGIQERKCKLDKDKDDGDFEKWYARVDQEGKPDCLMGHKQFFWRRRADADCYVGDDFNEEVVEQEICACTEEDYECDFNFVLKDGKCEPVGNLPAPEGACRDPKGKYTGSSGYRLIPGNTCDKEKGKVLDGTIQRKCEETVAPPTSGKITSATTTFSAAKIVEYYYLERAGSSTGTDETIIMRTSENEVYLSNDHGKTWKQVLKEQQVVAIYPNPYFLDNVYFITASTTVHYSTDRGNNFKTFKTLTKPNMKELRIMDFHPSQRDSFIWNGQKDCEQSDSKGCHVISYATKDGGDSWSTLMSWVRKCSWIPDRLDLDNPGIRIYCEHYKKEDGVTGDLELVASDDLFNKKTVAFPEIIGFATMEEFILIAAINGDGSSLKLDVSIDGTTFADAKFPANFKIDHQQAYTVLDSVTHAVFLHVSVNTQTGSEYGSLLKSNSNGTSYVLSLNYVNRNGPGYVDFEKMQGLEGVAIVNVVTNTDATVDGAKKKLRSMITHNDGGEWAYLVPPPKDSDGKSFECEGKIESCSLNLHGYTERRDTRDTYSSGSAVGLMIGVGNVGDVLKNKGDCDTFLTSDGGVSWTEIRKGSFMWEYGDQGSIIVIVDETQPTNEVQYTLNEGKTWESFKFADEKIMIEDISTVPSDTSRNFLLWAKPGGIGEKFITINLDFTGLTNVKCEYDADGPGEDFWLWAPGHPLQEDGCLFGHTEQYRRKLVDHLCYIGPRIPQPHKRLNNCSCTRQDYECDFNYERDKHGECKLVKGTEKPDHSLACQKDKNLIEYFEPTGYRRLPLTTCENGKELDKWSTPHYCPGKEGEFGKKHGGVGGFGIFFLVLVSFAMAGALGYVIWHRWSGKFGQIRLGDGVPGSSSSAQSPFIHYPIIVVSAIVAVAAAIPVIVGTVYQFIASKLQKRPRYTSRGQFARGDYSTVVTNGDDEGELLGDDSDEEV